MVDCLIRIGSRAFNLAHVSSIEPSSDGDGMIFHVVYGRSVLLRGADAWAARRLVESLPESCADEPSAGPGGIPFEVADDRGGEARGDVVDGGGCEGGENGPGRKSISP